MVDLTISERGSLREEWKAAGKAERRRDELHKGTAMTTRISREAQDRWWDASATRREERRKAEIKSGKAVAKEGRGDQHRPIVIALPASPVTTQKAKILQAPGASNKIDPRTASFTEVLKGSPALSMAKTLAGDTTVAAEVPGAEVIVTSTTMSSPGVGRVYIADRPFSLTVRIPDGPKLEATIKDLYTAGLLRVNKLLDYDAVSQMCQATFGGEWGWLACKLDRFTSTFLVTFNLTHFSVRQLLSSSPSPEC